MGLFRWFLQAFGREEVAPLHTRLSAAEAVQIARAALAGDPFAEQLSMTTVTARDGAVIWTVSAPVIGHNVVVEIDDRTGALIRTSTEGVR